MKSKRHISERPAATGARAGADPLRKVELHLPVPVPGKPAINPQVRHEMIASAAYYRAEKRSFNGGSELEDWLEAEAEIERMLSGSEFQYH